MATTPAVSTAAAILFDSNEEAIDKPLLPF